MFSWVENEEDGRKVLTGSGVLDAQGAWLLKRQLLAEPAGSTVILDLSNISPGSECGVALLAHGLPAIEAHGRTLVWRGLPLPLARVVKYLCAANHRRRELGERASL